MIALHLAVGKPGAWCLWPVKITPSRYVVGQFTPLQLAESLKAGVDDADLDVSSSITGVVPSVRPVQAHPLANHAAAALG